METVTDFIWGGSKITTDGDFSYEIKRSLLLRRKAMTNIVSILKNRDINLLTNSSSQSFGFSSSHVWMWELDYKESWALKNYGVEETLESPMDCKEIQPVHPRGNQSWIFIGRTNAEAETPILWPPDCEELTHLKRPWCWKWLNVGGEGDSRRWDGWMASLTRWTWVWVSSGSWWWTGKPGMLRFMGSQRVGHDWATELNWITTESLLLYG